MKVKELINEMNGRADYVEVYKVAHGDVDGAKLFKADSIEFVGTDTECSTVAGSPHLDAEVITYRLMDWEDYSKIDGASKDELMDWHDISESDIESFRWLCILIAADWEEQC